MPSVFSNSSENLKIAFSGESQARNRYAYFADVARREGYHYIAKIFEETAENEMYHALEEYKLMHGRKNTAAVLQEAIDAENYESAAMYPAFAQQAEAEGHQPAAILFTQIAKIEKQHRDRFRHLLHLVENGPDASPDKEPPSDAPSDLEALLRPADEFETTMADIHEMAETGQSISEPMRTRKPTISWDDLLIKGAQLAKLPLNADETVATRTVIGPGAAHPLILSTPVYISHMSFGALSKEAKVALATGSAAVKTAMGSGEGGILPESFERAHGYIFEYIPNRYSVNSDNLKKVDAVEIKFGQSAKPGMGGHLPGSKVTEEIAGIRGFEPGKSITSPAHYPDILNQNDLKKKVDWLREASGGKPVGIKFAAGHVEADLETALFAGPDFITIDGRAGSTGSAPKFVKAAKSLENFLTASTAELQDFARLTGNNDIHALAVSDLCTTNSEISSHTDVEHV